MYPEVRAVGVLSDQSNPTPPVKIVNGQAAAHDDIDICQRNANDEMKGIRI